MSHVEIYRRDRIPKFKKQKSKYSILNIDSVKHGENRVHRCLINDLTKTEAFEPFSLRNRCISDKVENSCLKFSADGRGHGYLMPKTRGEYRLWRVGFYMNLV